MWEERLAQQLSLFAQPLFDDRAEAGRRLADSLRHRSLDHPVVVGLACGGVPVAAEVARALQAPLDVVAVRKIGHPWQPEYALGAVAPRHGHYLRDPELTVEELAPEVARAREAASALDRRLHAKHPAVALEGMAVVLVDDGLATGATMIAAARWARAARAARVVAAVPVAAAESVEVVSGEVDELVALHRLHHFRAVGLWYASFAQVDDGEVVDLLAAAATTGGPVAA